MTIEKIKILVAILELPANANLAHLAKYRPLDYKQMCVDKEWPLI